MRIALKIAYIGTDYHGSQVQPDVKTIEGELFRALRDLNIINDPHEANFSASGRTDGGVHALGQVIAFDTDKPNIALPRAVNSRLPKTIWAWARAQVHPDFDPRRNAKYREYRYVLSGKYDLSLLLKASDVFIGEHDFYNFVTPEKERGSICKVEKIELQEAGECTIMDIRAGHFLWHMVRKIAAAMKMVGEGKRDLNWLENMLNPFEFREGIEPAPAYGLVFKNVEYESITWREDAYAKKSISKALDEHFLRHSVMAQILGELKEGVAE